MNGNCEPAAETLCGCCTGISAQTPELITNRAALSSIGYRVGRWATFDASLLAALSSAEFPTLAGLRTRDSSDFSIALLDAWAVVLDILTFYQERFANEAYLRTAIDQRSVFELAALVGYAPSPGVSASAVLAFTLSSATGSPDNVPIPTGARVQSVPGPGQTAQVFETSANLTALIGCNALPAQKTSSWSLAAGASSTWIAGTANNINVGDMLLFVAASGGIANALGPGEFHPVTAVSPDPSSGNTQISWDTALTATTLPDTATSDQICMYAFGRKAALYGVQAPNPQTLNQSNVSSLEGYPTDTPGQSTWNYKWTGSALQINLDASYPGLGPPAPGPPGWIALTGAGFSGFFQIQAAADTNPGLYTLTIKTTQLTLQNGQIVTGGSGPVSPGIVLDFVENTPNITAYISSRQLTPCPLPLLVTAGTGDATYTLQTGMLTPAFGASVAVVGGQQITGGQPIGITAQRLRLQVPLGANAATFVPAGNAGGSQAAGGQVFLLDAFPHEPDNAGNTLWTVETLSGMSGTLRVPAGVEVTLTPADAKNDAYVTEAAIVQSALVSSDTPDVTTLTLAAPLARIYDASSLKVNANAVVATDGQTVQEILGSGDATNPALQFTLKQAPLTYVSAPNSSGVQSTLQVFVNNLQWTEVPNLLESGAADRVFVTTANAAGNRVVTFGNGVQGARAPTGTANIRATYRTGIGSPGMVSAGQLSQPLDRPQGVQNVTNPGAATGAADPATPDAARASAPLPTLTLGRVVSLEDYQNFALGFAGIAKASASWTWFGDIRGVFLTVAGEQGAVLDGNDPIINSLITAITTLSEPFVPLRVASYQPVLFTFAANIAIDQPTYAADTVLAAVWQALTNTFAFEQRQLGQRVATSEIIAVIQQVPGVVALQLASLNRSGQAPGSPPPAILGASGPVPPAGAELLSLDPATIGAIGAWSP